MRIVDGATGEELPEGAEGEILPARAGLFVGYLDPADNAGVFEPDGFFRMGDLGRRVAGGPGGN